MFVDGAILEVEQRMGCGSIAVDKLSKVSVGDVITL
jgi:hypothetical protein